MLNVTKIVLEIFVVQTYDKISILLLLLRIQNPILLSWTDERHRWLIQGKRCLWQFRSQQHIIFTSSMKSDLIFVERYFLLIIFCFIRTNTIETIRGSLLSCRNHFIELNHYATYSIIKMLKTIFSHKMESWLVLTKIQCIDDRLTIFQVRILFQCFSIEKGKLNNERKRLRCSRTKLKSSRLQTVWRFVNIYHQEWTLRWRAKLISCCLIRTRNADA